MPAEQSYDLKSLEWRIVELDYLQECWALATDPFPTAKILKTNMTYGLIKALLQQTLLSYLGT